jgi:hypothetical protein
MSSRQSAIALTAIVVARCLRRAIDADRARLSAIVATSHDDLQPALKPDIIAWCDFGRVQWRQQTVRAQPRSLTACGLADRQVLALKKEECGKPMRHTRTILLLGGFRGAGGQGEQPVVLPPSRAASQAPAGRDRHADRSAALETRPLWDRPSATGGGFTLQQRTEAAMDRGNGASRTSPPSTSARSIANSSAAHSSAPRGERAQTAATIRSSSFASSPSAKECGKERIERRIRGAGNTTPAVAVGSCRARTPPAAPSSTDRRSDAIERDYQAALTAAAEGARRGDEFTRNDRAARDAAHRQYESAKAAANQHAASSGGN